MTAMRLGEESWRKMSKVDAWGTYRLHLALSTSLERMHLDLAFAQGLHAEPHPADHFMFRGYAK